LFHLVLETHDGGAVVLIPKRSTSPRSDIDAVMVDSLKALDPERAIREANSKRISEKLPNEPFRSSPAGLVGL
jgi:hypothetical protein